MVSKTCTTLFAGLILIHASSAATVTLTNLPAYESQRSCAKQCFYIGFSTSGGPDRLADMLDCEVNPIENDCFCRADLQDDADAFIQSCVYDYCSKNTVDVTSAVSIYDSYCTSAGYNREVETTPASGSSVTSSPITSSGAYQTSSFGDSDSSTSSSSSNDDTAQQNSTSTTGLSTSELIGIVVGVCGFIATSVGVWFSYRMLKNKRAAAHGTASFVGAGHGQHLPMGPVAYKYPITARDNYYGHR